MSIPAEEFPADKLEAYLMFRDLDATVEVDNFVVQKISNPTNPGTSRITSNQFGVIDWNKPVYRCRIGSEPFFYDNTLKGAIQRAIAHKNTAAKTSEPTSEPQA